MFLKIKKFFEHRAYHYLKHDALFSKKMWELSKPYIEIKNNIEKEKDELDLDDDQHKKITWGKFLLLFLFINFTILEIFTGWVTIQSFTLAYAIGMMPDFTPLITLLSLVLGETLSYGIYCYKSKAENIKGGIVYDLAMKQYEQFNDDQGVG
jgi:hypothetical protein